MDNNYVIHYHIHVVYNTALKAHMLYTSSVYQLYWLYISNTLVIHLKYNCSITYVLTYTFRIPKPVRCSILMFWCWTLLGATLRRLWAPGSIHVYT